MAITRVALCLSFAFLFYEVGGAKVTFMNRCVYTVWPGTLNLDSNTQLSTTGFELGQGATKSVDLPSPLAYQFWARTGCSNNNGNFSCATGDCGSGQVECNGADVITPATLVDIKVASNGGQDLYSVSNTYGFNVPVSVTPRGGNGPCEASSCPANINYMCPPELQVTGSDLGVIACKSACMAFNTDQYCCRGDYITEGTCLPTDYSMFFENQCPDAYSYAYDDNSSTFTCSAGPDYTIIFCPSDHLLYPSVTIDGSLFFKCY